MKKFIDIHNHIIFDFDDGPSSFDETRKMLDIALEQNIGTIFATSHFDEYTPDEKLDDYYEKLSIIQDYIAKEKLPLNIYPGAEIYFHSNLVESVRKYKNYILNEDSGYVLFEFPMFQTFSNLDIIFHMKINKIIPIVAHPERYATTFKNWKIVAEFIKIGALIQINAGSILGHYGSPVKKIVKQLLQKKYVHIVASDAHNTNSRTFILKDAYHECLEFLPEEYVKKIFFTIPEQIIKGIPFEPSSPLDINDEKNLFSMFLKKIHLKK